MNLRQIKAIEAVNKKRILAVNPNVPEESGIYILTREENGFKYAYVGQAKNLLSRLAQHLSGYQHIDLSIKKHGLYSEKNTTGYKIDYQRAIEWRLDEWEQYYIKEYATNGFQLRNKTSGSQGKGKHAIADTERKGYRDGLKNGYTRAQKEIAKLFDKYLVAEINGTINKLKEKAMTKFIEFIGGETNE